MTYDTHDHYMYSYRSLDAWKRAHELCMATLQAIDQAYQPRAGAIFEQLRRAAISVEANIVEGYSLETAALFRRHLRIARGSAAEAECLLRISAEMGYLPRATTDALVTLTGHTLALILALMRSPRLRRKS